MAAQTSESEEINKDAEGNPLDPENYFAVEGKKWDPKAQDHAEIISPRRDANRFRDVDDAIQLYRSCGYDDFPDSGGQDVRLDLVHYRFGIRHIVKTKILFP